MKTWLCGLAAPLLLSGCATMVLGGSQEVWIESDPPGASVTLQGAYAGEAPLLVRVSRKGTVHHNPTILVEKQGYQPVTVTLTRYVNGWTFLNIFNLGIGLIFDLITGAMYSFEPEELFVKLRKP